MRLRHGFVVPAVRAEQPEVGELAKVCHLQKRPDRQTAKVIHVVANEIARVNVWVFALSAPRLQDRLKPGVASGLLTRQVPRDNLIAVLSMGNAPINELHASKVLDVDAYLPQSRTQHAIRRGQRNESRKVQAYVLARLRALPFHGVELAIRGRTQVVVGMLEIASGLVLGTEIKGDALGLRWAICPGTASSGLPCGFS